METLRQVKATLEELCNIKYKIKPSIVYTWLTQHSDLVTYHITTESGYWQVKIYSNDLPREQGYLRIYEDTKGEMHFQIWTPCEMKYSGISTFPSARRR